MEYYFLLLVFSGVAALGALAFIYWAYVSFAQSDRQEGWKLLVGALFIVLLSVPCSIISFVGHWFINVDSEWDWVKTSISWIGVPPVFYYLLYCLTHRLRPFNGFSSRCWIKITSSGVLSVWALEALMVYKLATTS